MKSQILSDRAHSAHKRTFSLFPCRWFKSRVSSFRFDGRGGSHLSRFFLFSNFVFFTTPYGVFLNLYCLIFSFYHFYFWISIQCSDTIHFSAISLFFNSIWQNKNLYRSKKSCSCKVGEQWYHYKNTTMISG